MSKETFRYKKCRKAFTSASALRGHTVGAHTSAAVKRKAWAARRVELNAQRKAAKTGLHSDNVRVYGAMVPRKWGVRESYTNTLSTAIEALELKHAVLGELIADLKRMNEEAGA